jgi:hypothetical protein
MQRANGDWFALKERAKLRVPVFASNREAMQARAFRTAASASSMQWNVPMWIATPSAVICARQRSRSR